MHFLVFSDGSTVYISYCFLSPDWTAEKDNDMKAEWSMFAYRGDKMLLARVRTTS